MLFRSSVQRGDIPALRLESLTRMLPSRSAAVEFVVGAEELYVFVLTVTSDRRSQVEVKRIPWKRQDVAREVREFRRLLATRSLGYSDVAARLYRRIFDPVASQLSSKDELILVPDGALWELPFQALRMPDGAHLIERRAVSYAPSLTYLQEDRKSTRLNSSHVKRSRMPSSA